MTFGVLLMQELLADSWDIQALVSPNIRSLPHFSSLHKLIFTQHTINGIGLQIPGTSPGFYK